jgi:hypothetical protein
LAWPNPQGKVAFSFVPEIKSYTAEQHPNFDAFLGIPAKSGGLQNVNT